MDRLLLAAVLVVVAVAVALIIERRRPDPPTQSRTWPVPTQLDRNDFAGSDRPWLVVVFSSATCDSCAEVIGKARALEGADVAVEDVEAVARRDLHQRYGIEAVPCLVLTDAAGVVRASFVGTPSAADLEEALTAARRAV